MCTGWSLGTSISRNIAKFFIVEAAFKQFLFYWILTVGFFSPFSVQIQLLRDSS